MKEEKISGNLHRSMITCILPEGEDGSMSICWAFAHTHTLTRHLSQTKRVIINQAAKLRLSHKMGGY